MRSNFRNTVLTLALAFICSTLFAQNPIKWSFKAMDAGNCQVDLIFTGVLEDGWCTYSQFLESEDGPVATSLHFEEGATLNSSGKQPKAVIFTRLMT